MAENYRTGAGNGHRTGVATYQPGSAFVPLRQAMDRLFQDSFLAPSLFNSDLWPSGWSTPSAVAGTNLWETNESYVLQIALPGMQADSIEVSVEQNVLTCKGQPAVQAPANATALWQSFGGQTGYRIQLPAEVESGQAQATYQDGVLTITLPKASHARTHSIKVTAAK